MNRKTKSRLLILLMLVVFLSIPPVSEAYVGPGAGFAFVSSFFILFATFIIAVLTLVSWPLRRLFKAIMRKKRAGKDHVKRVVIVGLDGQDPDLTEEFMNEGILPNFVKLRDQGSFNRLQTTLPAESPVAWSSFQTGCNPGKHKIYDFLVPNRKSMLPELSSANVSIAPRILNVGKFKIPLGKPRTQVGRKSQPFWKILGEYGIFSSILRVPITFPPEKINGVLLSAMCVPDLKGSQGTFFYYTSDPNEKQNLTSGIQLPLEKNNGVARGTVSGPENTLVQNGGEMQVPFEIRLGKNGRQIPELILDKDTYSLPKGEYTPWVRLNFRPGLGMKVYGLCRFMLLETSPHVRLYVTPIQIDPERPALPISYPSAFSIYLAKMQGPFSTLGVAEDTSGLNEHIIDEDAFLKQCYSIHDERETMFFDVLEKTPRGLLVCVFDITDRLQHMFFRYLEDNHPASKGKYVNQFSQEIRSLYLKMDDLVGRVLEKMDDDTVLIVLSDHGCKSFRREVNLNAWLKQNGYLVVKENASGGDMLQDVDWSRTKAYAVGFGGIYLNLPGLRLQIGPRMDSIDLAAGAKPRRQR